MWFSHEKSKWLLAYGSVQKLGGKRRKPYRVRKTIGWSEEGKQLYQTIGYFETRKEAMFELAKFNQNPWDIEVSKTTFSDVYILSDKQRKKGSTNNEAGLKIAFNYCKKIHNTPINKIKTIHLQEIIDDMHDKSLPTKRKVKQIMKQVFNYAFANDIVEKNYVEAVKIENTIQKEKLHKPFTTEQIKDMLQSDDFFKKLTLVLCFTGFRIEELLELKTENVDLEKRIIIGGKKTKAGTNRTVPISNFILDIIKDHYTEGQELLFLNKHGRKLRYNYFRQHFKEIFSNNTTHDGRHTFASLCDNARINKVTIQKIMGHVGDNITDKVYTHKNTDELIKAIDELDEYIGTIIK